MATPHWRDPIEDDLRRHHIAVARGGKNGADDLFYVVLHEPFGHTIRPGFPVRVLVTHDLVLEPYKG
jgi:hypothetical protein